MKKVSARWVPKLLSAVQRQERVRCASEFLDLCGENPKTVIERLVTGDETMILYETCCRSASPKIPEFSPKTVSHKNC
ncbi:unnamed protein product [Parnassius mnemosyne]|uniref:Uncharacterized protein n=1 Tax=Parnassius mnemosyne TaxID=213953 RepID=A0AAV1KX89_9NEOP